LSVMLSVKNVAKRFGGLVALNRISIDVYENEILGIVGPNGAGKTTLFNCITGFLNPEEGKIVYKDTDITGWPPYRIAKLGIARTFQIVKPLPKLSVLENVIVSAFMWAKNKEEAENVALDVLKFVGLYAKKEVKAESLNIVEKKLMEIARALAMRPKVLLLDEVVAGLPQGEITSFIELLKKIHAEGVTLVVVEHVMRFVASSVERLIVLANGVKISEGPVEEVLNDPKVIEVYLGSREVIH